MDGKDFQCGARRAVDLTLERVSHNGSLLALLKPVLAVANTYSGVGVRSVLDRC